MQLLAVIDCGTNTFHLLIASVDANGDLETLHREKIVVKIGEGGITRKIITKEAQERAVRALEHFKEVLQKYQIESVTVLSTSAFRNASNVDELLAEIKKETGFDVQIISGQLEAELIYYGVKQAVSLDSKPSLIIDIGGGSVEFIICDHNTLFWKNSYEIGAQRLLDMFHRHDPILAEDVAALESYLDEQLASLRQAIERFNPQILIGSSGTFDTLSDIYRIKHQISGPVQAEEPKRAVQAYLPILDEIIKKNHQERLDIPGMMAFRVDMIVVASCLIRYLISRFPLESLVVSHYALKEGTLYKILHRDPLFINRFVS